MTMNTTFPMLKSPGRSSAKDKLFKSPGAVKEKFFMSPSASAVKKLSKVGLNGVKSATKGVKKSTKLISSGADISGKLISSGADISTKFLSSSADILSNALTESASATASLIQAPLGHHSSLDKEALKKDLQRRLENCLQLQPGNDTCADCPDKHPQWASLITLPNSKKGKRGKGDDKDKKDALVGVFCCNRCSSYHMQLGREICHVKNIKAIEGWTEDQVRALESSGNERVNAMYEARLDPKVKENLSSPSLSIAQEQNGRSFFVEKKYKLRMYYSDMTSSALLGVSKVPKEQMETEIRSLLEMGTQVEVLYAMFPASLVDQFRADNPTAETTMDDLDSDPETDMGESMNFNESMRSMNSEMDPVAIMSSGGNFMDRLMNKSIGNITPRSREGRKSLNALSSSMPQLELAGLDDDDDDDDDDGDQKLNLHYSLQHLDVAAVVDGDDNESTAVVVGENDNTAEEKIAQQLARKAVNKRPSVSRSRSHQHRGGRDSSMSRSMRDSSRSRGMRDSSNRSMSRDSSSRRRGGMEDSGCHRRSGSRRRRHSSRQTDGNGVHRAAVVGGPIGDANLEWDGSSRSQRREALSTSIINGNELDESEQEEVVLPEQPLVRKGSRGGRNLPRRTKSSDVGEKGSRRKRGDRKPPRRTKSMGDENDKPLRRRRNKKTMNDDAEKPIQRPGRRGSKAKSMRHCKSFSDLRFHHNEEEADKRHQRPKRRPTKDTSDRSTGRSKSNDFAKSHGACFDWNAWTQCDDNDNKAECSHAPEKNQASPKRNKSRRELSRSSSFNWKAWSADVVVVEDNGSQAKGSPEKSPMKINKPRRGIPRCSSDGQAKSRHGLSRSDSFNWTAWSKSARNLGEDGGADGQDFDWNQWRKSSQNLNDDGGDDDNEVSKDAPAKKNDRHKRKLPKRSKSLQLPVAHDDDDQLATDSGHSGESTIKSRRFRRAKENHRRKSQIARTRSWCSVDDGDDDDHDDDDEDDNGPELTRRRASESSEHISRILALGNEWNKNIKQKKRHEYVPP